MSAWRRLGFIGNPAGSAPWAVTHAMLPALGAHDAHGGELFLSSRDAEGRARIGRCHLALGASPTISAFDPEPVVDVGALGTFDDRGVVMSCLVRHERAQYLYYTGWSLGVTVPFYLFIGLAISTDGGRTFERASESPILDRGPGDPYLTASPCVLCEGGRWRMWYVSGSSWQQHAGGARHYYRLKYTESADGIRWERPARIAIDYADADEYAIGRPCVVRDARGYWMWFASRGPRYRIWCAESPDGIVWTRRDELGLQPSGSGWDSEETSYPWVFDARGHRYMLYNGNGYGRTGVGLAVFDGAETAG